MLWLCWVWIYFSHQPCYLKPWCCNSITDWHVVLLISVTVSETRQMELHSTKSFWRNYDRRYTSCVILSVIKAVRNLSPCCVNHLVTSNELSQLLFNARLTEGNEIPTNWLLDVVYLICPNLNRIFHPTKFLSF